MFEGDDVSVCTNSFGTRYYSCSILYFASPVAVCLCSLRFRPSERGAVATRERGPLSLRCQSQSQEPHTECHYTVSSITKTTRSNLFLIGISSLFFCGGLETPRLTQTLTPRTQLGRSGVCVLRAVCASCCRFNVCGFASSFPSATDSPNAANSYLGREEEGERLGRKE